MTATNHNESPVFAAVLSIVAVSAFGTLNEGFLTQNTAHGEESDRLQAGARLFRQHCVRCHGDDGSGKPARPMMPEISNFASNTWQDGRSNTRLQVSILDGRGDHMPAFGDRLSPQEARELIAHIRTLGRAKSADGPAPANEPEVRPQVGHRLFRQYCVRCHGDDGSGEPARERMSEISNFTSDTWQDRRSNSQLQVSILDGRGAKMPAFGDKLKQHEARELVDHIRTMRRTKSAALPADDFEERYRKLELEMKELMRQYRELSGKKKS
jgi:mono/diheme cytochrome c family protein